MLVLEGEGAPAAGRAATLDGSSLDGLSKMCVASSSPPSHCRVTPRDGGAGGTPAVLTDRPSTGGSDARLGTGGGDVRECDDASEGLDRAPGKTGGERSVVLGVAGGIPTSVFRAIVIVGLASLRGEPMVGTSARSDPTVGAGPDGGGASSVGSSPELGSSCFWLGIDSLLGELGWIAKV